MDLGHPRRSAHAQAAAILFGLAAVLASHPARPLAIEFDYRYDGGFFTAPDGTPLAERRAALATAASAFGGFSDSLAAIVPSPGNTWPASFQRPDTTVSTTVSLADEGVPAGTVRLFVGGSAGSPRHLAEAGPGSWTFNGSPEFVEAVVTRGQPGARAGYPPGFVPWDSSGAPTDFAAWGGSIWFNSGVDWYLGVAPSGVGASQQEFITVATIARTWQQYARAVGPTLVFTGPYATAAFGGPVPLDHGRTHWSEGTIGHVAGMAQEVLLSPLRTFGEPRQFMTDVDYAGLADIGWQLAPVPEPATWALPRSGPRAARDGPCRARATRCHRATIEPPGAWAASPS